MCITISSLEECVVCVYVWKPNSGFKRWFKVLEFEKSVPKLKPNGFKNFKESVSNLHLENLQNFQIVRIETGVLFSYKGITTLTLVLPVE